MSSRSNMNDKTETVSTSRKRRASYILPELLHVSPAPHMRRLDTVTSIMLDVIIALIPAMFWAVFHFGMRALYIVAISVVSAVASEAVYQLIAKKPVRIGDLSAAVTGLMLGLMMPSGVSLWVPCVGSIFAIVVVKQFFGGIGRNIVNPAVCARVFLMLCWPDQMVRYVNKAGDLVSSATPLVQMKAGTTPDVSLFNLVLGNYSGAIGEVSAVALCAGFIYLFFRRTVSWHIPVAYMGTVAVIAILAPSTGEASAVYYELMTGSLLFTALFCASDSTTL